MRDHDSLVAAEGFQLGVPAAGMDLHLIDCGSALRVRDVLHELAQVGDGEVGHTDDARGAFVGKRTEGAPDGGAGFARKVGVAAGVLPEATGPVHQHQVHVADAQVVQDIDHVIADLLGDVSDLVGVSGAAVGNVDVRRCRGVRELGGDKQLFAGQLAAGEAVAKERTDDCVFRRVGHEPASLLVMVRGMGLTKEWKGNRFASASSRRR